ncbi:MAG: helix-turn-helix transcriptional regulator [Bacteroidota bacterium]
MRIILHMGMGVALLMMALLLFKKQRKGGELYLAAWIGVCFVQMLFYELTLYQAPGILTDVPAILSFALVLLNMPLLHGYIRYMMGIPLKPSDLFFHLSPYLLYSILFIVIIYALDVKVTGRLGYLVFDEQVPQWLYNYAIPSAVLSPFYCGWNLWLLQKHRNRLPQLFSYQESISLAWIQYLIYGFILFTLAGLLLVFGATTFKWFSLESIFGVMGGILSLMILFTSFWGLRQTDVFADFNLPQLEEKKAPSSSYQKSGLSEEKAKDLAMNLLAYVEKEQTYLEEQLTLPQLAKKLHISSSHLSQVINQQYGQNFFDFINSYRIREAQKRLKDPQYAHYSILGIGLDCGFSSKSSFNRAFKKIVGQTPTQFRQASLPE